MSSTCFVIAPLAEANFRNSVFYAAWKQNLAIRFGASGILGNALFFGLDKMLFPLILRTAAEFSSNNKSSIADISKWIHQHAASVSFFVAYLIDIAIQHFLNAWLVFGIHTISTRDLYFSSLATSYTAYFGTLCGSTILQSYLLQWGLSQNKAFWSTIALGSLVNYFVLTYLNAAEKPEGSSTLQNHLGRNGTEDMSADGHRGRMALVPPLRRRISKLGHSTRRFH